MSYFLYSSENRNVNSSERGSILLELGIAIPLILFISFTGFEIARSALIRLVMSDIVREATVSSYLCSFRDPNSRMNCFSEVINELQVIAHNRFPPVDEDTPGMLLSLEAYEVDETSLPSRDDVCRDNSVSPAQVAGLPLRNLVSIVPPQMQQFKKYPQGGWNDGAMTIGGLFSGSSHADDFMLVTCLNGSVIVAEVHLGFEPIVKIDFSGFFFGSEASQGPLNWRKEYHAVVVL